MQHRLSGGAVLIIEDSILLISKRVFWERHSNTPDLSRDPTHLIGLVSKYGQGW
jgi:hypothetical protein